MRLGKISPMVSAFLCSDYMCPACSRSPYYKAIPYLRSTINDHQIHSLSPSSESHTHNVNNELSNFKTQSRQTTPPTTAKTSSRKIVHHPNRAAAEKLDEKEKSGQTACGTP